MISPLFTTIVLGAAFIWLYMKMTTKKEKDLTQAYLDREREANSVRKKPLNNLTYITVDPTKFPVPNPAPSELADELYKRIQALSSQKIVNLTGISNTDLKLEYGVANLSALTEYDQNYTFLCRTIYDLGREMVSLDYKEEAMTILEQGVACGSDIAANYLLLADLYLEAGRKKKVEDLITAADDIRSLTRAATVEKLTEKLNAPDSTVSADIRDILETVPGKSDDQMQ